MPLIARSPRVGMKVKRPPTATPATPGMTMPPPVQPSITGTGSYGPTKPPKPPTPPPFDPIHEGQIGLNTSTFQNTNIGLDASETSGIRAYGLDNTDDPFSRAQLLREAYERNARGAGNSMASRGQLYSGAYQNAQNSAAHSFDIGYHGLRGEQNDFLSKIAQRRSEARGAYDQGNIDADAAAIDRATQNRPDAATLPAPKPKKKHKVKISGRGTYA